MTEGLSGIEVVIVIRRGASASTVILEIAVLTVAILAIAVDTIEILTTHDVEPPSFVRGATQALRNYVGQDGIVENSNRARPIVGDQYSGSSISTQPIASITTTWVPQRT